VTARRLHVMSRQAINGAPRTLTIGTRGSKLALRQVEIVAAALRIAHPGLRLNVREIKTEGDRTSAPLSEIGGLGVFTKAIEDALLAGEIDIAVHSLKDLPADVPEGLILAAIPERGDPRDALVTPEGLRLDDLARGARIGTGAGRRAVHLLELRRDVEPADIRGNVDTRIRKVLEGEYDGAVLAMAGLARLGLEARASQVFSIDEMLPAVGQGALAVEARTDDDETVNMVVAVDDADTRAAVEAERAYLRRLGGGCRLPVGAYASIDHGELWLRGMIAAGSTRIFRGEVRGAPRNAESLGAQLADVLLDQGAAKFIDV
jgi:hydroxymethylbilane synthase